MKVRLILLILILAVILAWMYCSRHNPRILIQTEFGDIIAELYMKQAPASAGNFLLYVRENRVEDDSFYRVVTMDNQPYDSIRIQVIQGMDVVRTINTRPDVSG